MMEQRCLIFVFLLCLGCSSACFITNCPVGGKRSLGHFSNVHRQCSPCGPGGKGRCFGPWICCGADFGCRLLSLKDSGVCEMEDNYPVPCDNPGERCGDNGRCAIKGLCCSTDGCASDESCTDGPTANQPEVAAAQRPFPMLMNLNSPPLLR